MKVKEIQSITYDDMPKSIYDTISILENGDKKSFLEIYMNNMKDKMPEEKKEIKLGMYGEMPTIKIGKFIISDISDEENCSTVWIYDTESNEGGQFCKIKLSEILDKFYKELF